MTRVIHSAVAALPFAVGLAVQVCAQEPSILYAMPYANAAAEVSAFSENPEQFSAMDILKWRSRPELPDSFPDALITELTEANISLLRTIPQKTWVDVKAGIDCAGAPARLQFNTGESYVVFRLTDKIVVTDAGGVLELHETSDHGKNDYGTVYFPNLPDKVRSDCEDDVAPHNFGLRVENDALHIDVSWTRCGGSLVSAQVGCAFQAVRLMDSVRGLFCTGTMISSNHVLTAAHCLCDRVHNGRLQDRITVSVGIGRDWGVMIPDPESVRFFNGGSVCASSGQLYKDRIGNGDLAIVSVPEGSFATAVDKLIEKRGEALDVTQSLAPIASRDLPGAVWMPNAAGDNEFITIGFGTGRDLRYGVKRAMSISVQRLGDCHGKVDTNGRCLGYQSAIFHEEGKGLCSGDSGSGMFKYSAERRDDYGPLVLMGVVSGMGTDSLCHDAETDAVLDSQLPRSVVRIDTKAVQDWLDDVVGAERLFRAWPLDAPSQLFADDSL